MTRSERNDAKRDRCEQIERQFSDGAWVCQRQVGHGGPHGYVWRMYCVLPASPPFTDRGPDDAKG
jgi:hypothetical protein